MPPPSASALCIRPLPPPSASALCLRPSASAARQGAAGFQRGAAPLVVD